MRTLPLLVALTTLYSPSLLATESNKTYQACSVLATEVFTAIQLFDKKFDLETLYKTLPEITDKGKERLKNVYISAAKNGVLETYSKANAQYSQCSKAAYKTYGKPSKDTLNHLFYVCSGESKLRYEIILAVHLGGSLNEILSQVHPSRKNVASHIFKLHQEKGTIETFNFSATELKRCLMQ